MKLAGHILQTDPPPLTPLMERAARMRAEGRELFVLAQAMVDYAPPRIFTDSLIEACRKGDRHGYAPDAGIPELREALGRYLAESFGIQADPAREILVTPGANHAAYTALSVILEPGDEAILLSPYYFNHEMTVMLQGGRSCFVEASAINGYLPDVERILAAWTPRTRVLVLVNPSNPTGAVYPDRWVRELAGALEHDDRWRDVWILCDQTYQEITFTDERPLSMASLSGIRERVITVSSFSKSFALAGWRLGFLTAPGVFVDETLKIQDSSVISAANAAQWALAQTIGQYDDCRRFFAEKRQLLAGRRDALLAPLLDDDRVEVHTPGGACFAFVGLPMGMDAERFAWDLMSARGVVTVPGVHFGRPWTRHLRLSFGSGTDAELRKASERLVQYIGEKRRQEAG